MAVTPVTEPLWSFNPKARMDWVPHASPDELIKLEQTCRGLLRLEDNHREYRSGWFRSVFLAGHRVMPQAPERIGRFRMTVASLLQRVAAVETEARMENARVDRERAWDAQEKRDAAWLRSRGWVIDVLREVAAGVDMRAAAAAILAKHDNKEK